MFLRTIGFVAVLLGFAAWGLAQHRWAERMLAQVNQSRPADKRIPAIGAGPFQVLEAWGQYRRTDPVGFRRALLAFSISGLLLMGAMIGLTSF